MRKQFAGHFRLSKAQQAELWKTGIVVFDANVLLHLYRYSDQTRSDLLATIEKLQDRAWIPHRVAVEYFRRRLDVIVQQQKAYSDAIVDLNKIEETLKNQRHPFVSQKTFQSIQKVLDDARKELQASIETHLKRLTNDDLLDKIADLFDQRVGEPFSDEDTKKLCSEAERRFAAKIPPGYKDQDKSTEGDPTRPYGDFFVWNQTLEMAAIKKSGVIFVTDDSKEDWWLSVGGKTIGPRPELIQEFRDRCQNNILILSTYRFMEEAGIHLKSKHHDQTVNEMKVLRQDERAKLSALTKENEERALHGDLSKTQAEMRRMLSERQLVIRDHLLREERILDQIRSELPRHEYKQQDVNSPYLEELMMQRAERVSMLRKELGRVHQALTELGVTRSFEPNS
jgi:hypothetical protein